MERNCILPVPDDLVQDILSRLPVRDLLRLRCVSREWCALIDNASFITKHYFVQHYICKGEGDMPQFVHSSPWLDSDKFYFLSLQQGDVSTLDVTADLERDSKDVFIYAWDLFNVACRGCVNGVICLTWNYRNINIYTDLNNRDFIGLWNPATREFKVVAYPNMPARFRRSPFHIIGFGFDPLSNDFKILGKYNTYTDDSKTISYHEVYSLRANSWKKVGEPPAGIASAPTLRTDGYLNGVCYWTRPLEDEKGKHLVIVSFHLGTEVFKVFDPPDEAISLESHPTETMITLYKESLALVRCQDIQEVDALYSVDVWTVTQFDCSGVPTSWQHTFTIKPTHAKLGVDVAASRIDGSLLLNFYFSSKESTTPCGSDVDCEFILYKPSTGEYKKLRIDGFSTCFRYVESLFPLSRRLIQR